MTAEESLRSYEDDAVQTSDESTNDGGGFYNPISNVGGKKDTVANKAMKGVKFGGNIKKFGALVVVVVVLLVVVIMFSAANLLPAALSNRIQEETDVQHADAVMSRQIIFQQALREGDIPDNTTEILKEKGILVGYTNSNGEFVEENRRDGELSLKMGDQVISADQFIDVVNSDVDMYDGFNEATFSNAAGWFDESAEEVMRYYGTSRNNYSNGKSFNEVMDEIGSGNDINVSNMGQEKETETTTDSEGNETTKSEIVNKELDELKASGDAGEFVSSVGKQNKATDSNKATLNAADEMKVADTISNEQRSGKFYLRFMENISMMQAGYGNESQINEAMEFLYTEGTSQVVDVNTGKTITIKGTALESPSLYSLLTGEKIGIEEMQNYSNDRISKTVENLVGQKNDSINETIVSSDKDVKGSVGRFFTIDDKEDADIEILDSATTTINNSLIENSINDNVGILDGEALAEGAVVVGRDLAKYSGATAGDEEAVIKYARLTSDVLAMDAAVDRKHRSPFDITSKNTFLGSIVYDFAISMYYGKSNNNILANIASFLKTTGSFASSIFGVASADSENGYLTNFGDCETIGTIGAVGSPQCTMVATFDTSTLKDPLNNPDYLKFVEENIEGGNTIGKDSNLIASTEQVASTGGLVVKTGSKMAKFIKNNIRRITPVGMTDGGIIDSYDEETSGDDSVPFISKISSLFSKIVDKIKSLFTSEDNSEVKRASTGELYVNSSKNSDWSTYKWAQRYAALARAQGQMRMYAVNYDGRVAYNIKTLRGDENPIIAYIREYCSDDKELADNN